jgi:hypothetical protein
MDEWKRFANAAVQEELSRRPRRSRRATLDKPEEVA